MEIVPAAVVEMVPAAVVEMVPLRVVEIVPPLENAVTDKVNVSNAAISDVNFRFRIILSWSTKGSGVGSAQRSCLLSHSLWADHS